MSSFHRCITLAALLLAAIIYYTYGFSKGVVAFIAIGALFEILFWLGLFGTKSEDVDNI